MKSPILIHLAMPIRTPRLLIRPTSPGDGQEINNAIRESFDELTQWMPWAENMPSVDESEMHARQSYAKYLLREEIVMLILDPSGKTQLGAIGIHHINWDIPSCEIGYWVRSSAVKNGYITEAVNAVTRYAFAVLKAKRVGIRCDADNHRSAAIPERLGFTCEGRLRNNGLKCHGGGPADTLVFSRINADGLLELDLNWQE